MVPTPVAPIHRQVSRERISEMLRATSLRTSGARTLEFPQTFGTTEEVRENAQNHFVRGASRPGLKPRVYRAQCKPSI
jgi:hypothetical protein